MSDSSDKIWSIYCATNQKNNKRYIGLTVTKVDRRWQGHISDAICHRYKNSAFQKAIRKYGKENFIINILYEATSRREAIAVEKAMIIQYRTRVPFGYNITLGGEGTEGVRRVFSTVTKEKMRLAKLGRKLSEEHRFKIGKAHRGKKRSDAAKAKMSASQIGIKRKSPTEETKKKMAEAGKGRIVSQETRNKIGIANKGKSHPHSIETRMKISIGGIGRITSKKTKEKISIANKGRERTPDWRQALKTAWIERKARKHINHALATVATIDCC